MYPENRKPGATGRVFDGIGDAFHRSPLHHAGATAMSTDAANAIFGFSQRRPLILREQEYFLAILCDVGLSSQKWKLPRNPIRDLSNNRYALWMQVKAEIRQQLVERPRRYPTYLNESELAPFFTHDGGDPAKKTILDKWATSHGLTYERTAADWVIRWAADVFTRWDAAPQEREWFAPTDPKRMAPPVPIEEFPGYLMIPMEDPQRKTWEGESQRKYIVRMNRAIKSFKESLAGRNRVPAPPRAYQAPESRRPATLVHYWFLALRICGLELKEIQGLPPERRLFDITPSQATISRGTKRAAVHIQLDPP